MANVPAFGMLGAYGYAFIDSWVLEPRIYAVNLAKIGKNKLYVYQDAASEVSRQIAKFSAFIICNSIEPVCSGERALETIEWRASAYTHKKKRCARSDAKYVNDNDTFHFRLSYFTSKPGLFHWPKTLEYFVRFLCWVGENLTAAFCLFLYDLADWKNIISWRMH